MASEIVTVRNRINQPVSVIFNGKRVVIEAFEEMSMPQLVANKFLEAHPNSVENTLDDAFGASMTPQETPKTMWLANVTGNPDAPESFKYERFDKVTGKMIDVFEANPNRKPRLLKYAMKGAEVLEKNKDGVTESTYRPGRYFELSPYRLMEVDADVGRWIMQREMRARTAGGTACVIARKLPEFSPNYSWSIEDLRTYLTLLRDCDLRDTKKYGATTAMLTSQFGSKPKELELRIHDAKRALMKYIYFCQINPSIPLPTREEFEEARISKKDKAAKADDAAADQAFA